METILEKLATAVSDSDDLESLVRPLLELLEAITGMESTYLTSIDAQHNVQRIEFARNRRTLNIPEGLAVPWGDTLCKRALDEGRPYVDDDTRRLLRMFSQLIAPARTRPAIAPPAGRKSSVQPLCAVRPVDRHTYPARCTTN